VVVAMTVIAPSVVYELRDSAKLQLNGRFFGLNSICYQSHR